MRKMLAGDRQKLLLSLRRPEIQFCIRRLFITILLAQNIFRRGKRNYEQAKKYMYREIKRAEEIGEESEREKGYISFIY